MRTATLTSLLVVLGYTSIAQLTLQPQFGVENTRTSISYNNLSSFSPLGGQLSVQPGVRLDYKFKQGFGAFLGVTTSRSVVSFNFTDPETGMSSYKATPGDLQLRFEGGYQFSTKPIYFNKSSAGKQSVTSNAAKSAATRHCGNYFARGHCGGYSNKTSKSPSSGKGWYMSIQPAVGLAFVPSTMTDVSTKIQGTQPVYEYNSGNWNYALIAGSGFEFGKGAQRRLTISVNYLKGIGNLGSSTINTVSGGKATTTILQSEASGWNLRVGIPFSLNKQAAHKVHLAPKYEHRCGQYRLPCGRRI